MSKLTIIAGPFTFTARLEAAAAPRTCAAFLKLLPFREKLLHVRWSGESTWVPLGDLEVGVPPENATVYPQPGEILLYPGGVSETEILIPYGPTQFASKAGLLAGNHFMGGRFAQTANRKRRVSRSILPGGPNDRRAGHPSRVGAAARV